MTGEDFVAAARLWVGTPFRHACRQRGVGVDCVGLAIGVGNETGLLGGYDFTGYSAVTAPGLCRREVSRFCDEFFGADGLLAGDIVLFAFGGLEQHLAIYNGEGGIIHAYQSAGFVGEHEFTGAWRRQATGYFRPRWPEG